MKILSWNVAGLRARLKQNYLQFLLTENIEIICFQETKATPDQVNIPLELDNLYPFKFWNSNMGLTQKKGLSGTAIWSKIKPIQEISPPEFDQEGRITCIEFEEYYLLTVYTPNSQDINSERFKFRINDWDINFLNYINHLKSNKNIIICGDLNVCHQDIDIYNPIKYKNNIPSFYDDERNNFTKIIQNNFTDSLRHFHNDTPNLYTYWNQRIPSMRLNNMGYRLDYFLINKEFINFIKQSDIHPDIVGSDHCPVSITL